MQASIARTLALVCHANAKLRGLTVPALDLSHSTLQFARSVQFIVRKGSTQDWICVAREPSELLGIGSPHDYLRTLGTTCVRFEYSSKGSAHPWHDVGFVGGGGEWTMVTFGKDGHAQRWWSQEKRAKPTEGERIWQVEHAIVQVETRRPGPKESVPDATRALGAAIEAARAYAARAHPEFAPNFERGLRALDGARNGYHHDLAPPGSISEEALRLFEAAQTSWVFGGMGSWNDVGDRSAQYAAVSDALFAAQIGAITAAANDSSP